MNNLLFFAVIFLVVTVFVCLIIGLIQMIKEGQIARKKSNNMMIFRLVFQAVVVLLLIITYLGSLYNAVDF